MGPGLDPTKHTYTYLDAPKAGGDTDSQLSPTRVNTEESKLGREGLISTTKHESRDQSTPIISRGSR